MGPRHALFTLLFVAVLVVTTRSLTNPCDGVSCDAGEKCYATWENNTGNCFPDCSFDCNDNPCNVDTCECPEGLGGNFCEYPSCYDYCYLNHTLSCTGSDACVCDTNYDLPTCELYTYSDIMVLYRYLLKLWNGQVEDPSQDWCDSLVTSLDEENSVAITCDVDGRITVLWFTGGSYMFPDTFTLMTELEELVFSETYLSFIGKNIKHLPYGIKYLEFSQIHTPLHDTEDFMGDWGLPAISLETVLYTGDRLASNGYTQTTIPLEFVQQFTNLKVLYLTNAGITGTIPGDIFNIPTLEELLIVNSEISYVAPLVGTRKNTPLTTASLAQNNVAMSLSEFFECLPTQGTTGLYLTDNLFTGPIEIPETFTEFEYFLVSNNMLNGPIPSVNFMTMGAQVLYLDPADHAYECPMVDYSSWANTTDYSASFVTNCDVCDLGGCQHGGYCTARGPLRHCSCEEGWYGPYCAFETEEQQLVYDRWSSEYDADQSLCEQGMNECNEAFQLTKVTVGDMGDQQGDNITYMTNLTTLLANNIGTTFIAFFPESLQSIEANIFSAIITGSNGYDDEPLTLPNLKSLTVHAGTGPLTGLNLNLFPALEEFVFSFEAPTETPLPRIFLNHPTLKTLEIHNATITSFPSLRLLGNEVLETIDLTDSVLSPDLFMGFAELCDIMPIMSNLETLALPGFTHSTQPSMLTASRCAHFMPSTNLDLRLCDIGGTIPTFLQELGLESLLLISNYFSYPIADYSGWANTTDYGQFNDLITSACSEADCSPGEVCSMYAECTPLEELCVPPCLNGGAITGTEPFFVCDCAEGFYGPVCGFTSETYEDFYQWALNNGRIYVNTTTDPCVDNECDAGKFTTLIILSAYGDLFTKDDFDTTGITSMSIAGSNVWNAEEFMTQGFSDLELLTWNVNFINDTTFPLNSSLSAFQNMTFQYVQYSSSTTFYHPLRGNIATLLLSCEMMKNLGFVLVTRAPFSIEDCSAEEGTQNLYRLGLSSVQTNITTNRLMASFMAPIQEFAMNPSLTGTFDLTGISDDITATNGDGLPGPSGIITNASFYLEGETLFSKITLSGFTPLCPVDDYSLFATTNNYEDYSLANQESDCTFCRILEGECEEGYYCDNSFPACVLPPGFCDFPQCENGGTCLNDTCHCLGAYSGTYCEYGPECGCLNGGTCLDNGTCVCTILFTGPECATPVINPCECENGGTCLENGTCVCTILYTGDKCQTPLNPCDCENGGTCLLNGTCVCLFNYTGNKCQTYNPNPCDCQNNGTCLEDGDCVCPEGWTGDKCQTIYNPCDCENGGTCLLNGTCVCTPIYTGNKCQTPLNPCDCENGGTCLLNGTCLCPLSYIGNKCQTYYNPCNCENGGACLDNGTCICPPNYIGEKCEIYVSPCECQNGGTCTINGICICPDGYTGTKCQNVITLSNGAISGAVVGAGVGAVLIVYAIMNFVTGVLTQAPPSVSNPYLKMR